MKYPVGIQTFEKIRTEGYVYVDKTRAVYELTQDYRYIFLSRPRRFGKSLLLSTIKAYFQGRKDLFRGLEIGALEVEWAEHPVIHLDLNLGLYNSAENLHKHLNCQISVLEELYGTKTEEQTISDRFAGVIRRAKERSGRDVVILIDEYDKPLLEAIGKPDLQEAFREELRALYGVMKTQDQYIRFAMLTGVTKIGQLSVFSGLNNIMDISFHERFSAICGITQDEIMRYFDEPIAIMAEKYGVDCTGMLEKLRLMYDGYRFTEEDTKVFNPFSLLNAFDRCKLGFYWFDTGTPKYLVKLLRIHHYDIWRLEGTMADESQLGNVDVESSNPVPVIYQCGYLTIKHYNFERDRFTLGFPNEEVRRGFMEYLYPFYAQTRTRGAFDVDTFVDDIVEGDPLSFMERLKSLTADISYDILANCEDDFQNLIYIIMTLCSLKPVVERHTSDGRIDMVVETDKFIYVMEFKIDGSAKEAIEQIDIKNYTLPWAKDHRRIFKIGANFSTTERRLTDYIIR